MKTIKWLKTSVVLQIIYVLFCISSTVCFAINHYLDMHIFFDIGLILTYGWIINPTGILTLKRGLSLYFSEKSNEDFIKIIGLKWIWFIVFFVVDTLLFLMCGGMMVALTGI